MCPQRCCDITVCGRLACSGVQQLICYAVGSNYEQFDVSLRGILGIEQAFRYVSCTKIQISVSLYF